MVGVVRIQYIFNLQMASLLEFQIANYCDSSLKSSISSYGSQSEAQKLKKSLSVEVEKLGLLLISESKRSQASYEGLFFCVPLICNLQILFRINFNLSDHSVSLIASLLVQGRLAHVLPYDLFKNLVRSIKTINNMLHRSQYCFGLAPGSGYIQLRIPCKQSLSYTVINALDHLKAAIIETTQILKIFAIPILHACCLVHSAVLIENIHENMKAVMLEATVDNQKLTDLKELLPLHRIPIKTNKCSQQQTASLISEAIAFHISLTNNNLYAQSPLLTQLISPFKGLTQDFFDKALTYPIYKPLVNEPPYVINRILVSDQRKIVPRVIAEGGRSQITLVSMKFSIAQEPKKAKTNNLEEILCEGSSRPLIEKNLVMKVPRKSNKKIDESLHEREVLMSLKEFNSLYLLKYYVPLQQNFAYKDCLLMDYIPGFTLHQEMQLHKLSVTLPSKLTILGHLSNSIRFLSEHKVAHLDITPSNIMMTRDYMIKIIDFGEAYSFSTAQRQQKAGYRHISGKTFPFAPPETSTRKEKFTSQQDVFSLGVIAFKMLFGYLPFNQGKAEEFYKNGKLSQRLLFAPEQSEMIGSEDFMAMASSLVLKCLDEDEEKRPLPAWTHIFFKKLFYTLR